MLEIDLKKGLILDKTVSKTFYATAFPEFIEEIIKDGGLIEWIKNRGEKK
jgi:3-isopropylmalate/(R)-2-methylmalate dehydratase small subunit